MNFDGIRNWRFRTPIILPLLAALLVSYFAFYTFFGERSLFRLMQLEKQISARKSELADATATHDVLAVKVTHMRPSSIDPDLLDQQARRVLNYTAPDEIVIMTPAHASEKGKTETSVTQ